MKNEPSRISVPVLGNALSTVFVSAYVLWTLLRLYLAGQPIARAVLPSTHPLIFIPSLPGFLFGVALAWLFAWYCAVVFRFAYERFDRRARRNRTWHSVAR